MTDAQFKNELEIRAFSIQINGYPFGNPHRSLELRPIIVIYRNGDGSFNREQMLAAVDGFTQDEIALLRARD